MRVEGDRARALVLAKQGLAEAGPKDVLGAVEATAGVYGTAPTCYLSCAARLEGFGSETQTLSSASAAPSCVCAACAGARTSSRPRRCPRPDALAAADPASAVCVRPLPVWDAYFMGYRDRSRQVREDDYANVYDKAGNTTRS